MVHCLIVPTLLTLLPIVSLNTLVEEIVFHQLMLWLVLPTSIIGLFIGCKKHRQWSIAVSGFIGISILTMVALLGHDVLTIQAEKVWTTIGGLTLAVSHFLNFRACQNVPCSSRNCSAEHHH